MGRCEDRRLRVRGVAPVARARAVGAERDEEGGRAQERIERLISEHLPQKLEILSEKDLTLALESFVNKVRPPSHAWQRLAGEWCLAFCTLLELKCCQLGCARIHRVGSVACFRRRNEFFSCVPPLDSSGARVA